MMDVLVHADFPFYPVPWQGFKEPGGLEELIGGAPDDIANAEEELAGVETFPDGNAGDDAFDVDQMHTAVIPFLGIAGSGGGFGQSILDDGQEGYPSQGPRSLGG